MLCATACMGGCGCSFLYALANIYICVCVCVCVRVGVGSASAQQAYLLFTESSTAVDFITSNHNSPKYDETLKRVLYLQFLQKTTKLLCEEGVAKDPLIQ